MVIIYIFIFLIIILLLIDINEHFDDQNEYFDDKKCNNQSSSTDTMKASSMNAAEACKKISTEAENIAAHYGGIAEVSRSFNPMPFLDPNNYRAGDNKTNDMMRNIINVNMSDCDIKHIENTCKNTVSSKQSNIIDVDFSQCPLCDKYDCSGKEVKGIIQTNDAKAKQSCVMQTAIATLLKKTNSIDAQALAKVLQEASGPLSGSNTISKENCNIIAPDLSTASYLEQKSKCVNEIASEQENIIKGKCVGFSNILQRNTSDAIQSCMVGTDITKTVDSEGNVKVKHESDITQKSTGVTASASVASSASFFCFLSFFLIVGAVAGYTYLNQN